ncbi:hypothetical protein VTG60DRAFT_1324 [Thermothelomyces hinnuleus]
MPSPLTTLSLAVLASTRAVVVVSAASCSRAVLQEVTRAYVAAQEAGDASLLTALVSPHPNQIYLENNGLADLAKGALAEPLRIDFSRSIHDPDQCAAFTEIIGASDPHPRVIHTRFVLDPSSTTAPPSNSSSFSSSSWRHLARSSSSSSSSRASAAEEAVPKASLIESVVTDEGDWLFNATGTLELNAGEVWDEIPEEERAATAAEVQALGDAYFDRFGNESVVVPWAAEPCYRLEGGLPARGEVRDGECVMVFPSTIIVPYRRYVVDVTLGAASLFIGFPGLDRTQGDAPMPDSHLFRVEHGKIKYIHTASACVVKGCGLNATSLSWSRRSLKKMPVSFRG